MIAFVQPFGLQTPGGGSRILRGLIAGRGESVISICADPRTPPPTNLAKEIHLPRRPHFWKFERFPVVGLADTLYSGSFEESLRRIFQEHQVDAVHVIPHGHDFVSAYRVASKMGLDIFASVHDDIEYLARVTASRAALIKGFGELWRNATGITVISDAMGEECIRRYGKRSFEVITDGVTEVAPRPRTIEPKCVRVYFMGLFHIGYSQNLQKLNEALKIVRSGRPDWTVSITCRCGSLPDGFGEIKVLEFASEAQVQEDMKSADFLYFPLQFAESARRFVSFSMSTKLVTYLGSGIPILYHGPDYSAACKLLEENGAAAICTSLDPTKIAAGLVDLIDSSEGSRNIVENALDLARRRFLLTKQRERFWSLFEGAARSYGSA